MAIRSDLGEAVFAKPKKIQRAVANPMDKTTIVSVFPRKIIEIKETIFPGKFEIPAAPIDGFSILVIGSSSFFVERDPKAPSLEIPTGSLRMAQSIIRDWANGLVGCNMGDRMPGLFYLPGAFTEKTITAAIDENGVRFSVLIDTARARQKNWMMEQIRIADVDWARTNGNPRAISDDARLSAECLGLGQHKPWMQDFVAAAKINCKACGTMINPLYPKCPTCHFINDMDKAIELGIVAKDSKTSSDLFKS